jgi:hypothetical protein
MHAVYPLSYVAVFSLCCTAIINARNKNTKINFKHSLDLIETKRQATVTMY